eukprot:413493-Pyramimonas_sp.AAC.1
MSETFCGFWLINLISSTRYLLGVFRHSDERRCGCRARCSNYPILTCTRWQLRSMARGQRPVVMHAGEPFPARGLVRTLEDLGAATLESESQLLPALRERAQRTILEDLMPSQRLLRRHESYGESVARCEVRVEVLNASQLKQLCKSLRWFKAKSSKNSLRSRAVFQDIRINGVDLKIRDRLEPLDALFDTA